MCNGVDINGNICKILLGCIFVFNLYMCLQLAWLKFVFLLHSGVCLTGIICWGRMIANFWQVWYVSLQVLFCVHWQLGNHHKPLPALQERISVDYMYSGKDILLPMVVIEKFYHAFLFRYCPFFTTTMNQTVCVLFNFYPYFLLHMLLETET